MASPLKYNLLPKINIYNKQAENARKEHYVSP